MPLMVNGVQVDLTAKNSASPVIKQVASDVQALEVENNGLGESTSSAGDSMAGMAINATTLGQALSIAAIGVGAFVSAFVSAFEFGELAAANERLQTSGQQLATGYGESMDTIVTKVRDASLGTVSNMDIIASSNKAMMLGVGGDAEKLANLMEIAAFRGRAMGLETSQAFDDMARGIGRMSPMILDNLGIVVDAESTYATYAETIGKTANELTRDEKVQALLNKVIEEGNRQLQDAGGLVADNATSYERWNAELENTKNHLLENAIGMSHLADMGSDLLVSVQTLTEDGFGVGFSNLNGWALLNDFGASRVEAHKQEIYALRDSVNSHGDALDAIVPKMTTVDEAMSASIEVDAAAVKGAMDVHDTYEKLNGKMSDLEIEHGDLLLKKQELIQQGWWPESQKVQDVNNKLAENEQKQKDVTVAMQGTLAQMLLNTAAAGLDAEGQLALARATGQIEEATYAALTVQGDLKKQYEDGQISAETYATKTLELKGAVDKLESKGIEITVDAIYNEIRNITTNYVGDNSGHEQRGGGGPLDGGYADGGISTGPVSGHMELLHGTEAIIPLRGGSIPVQLQSPGGGNGGGTAPIIVQLTYAPMLSTASGDELQNKLMPFILQGVRQARSGVGV